MTRNTLGVLGATLLTSALTAFTTWPQARYMSTTIIEHHDVYFSIWRLAWVAHALATSPLHLFDANIFYPTQGTLAYSDAMLLQGLLAAPFFWLGVAPALIYNSLLMIGFVGSGVAMFILARYLTGSSGAALVAAAAFTMAPYRIEHVMHLELQWTMWVPLAFWALHRAVHEGSWRLGILAGAFVALQALACVYYGVFLGLLLLAFVPILLLLSGARALRALPAVAAAVVVAIVLTAPYAWQYARTADTLGGRGTEEIALYSASLKSYLVSAGPSRLWGWTSERWGARELRLFPGLIIIVLALTGLSHRNRRWLVLYAVTTAAAVTLSLGVNTSFYRWLLDHVAMLQGLRSTARAAIIATCALAALAAFGTQVLSERARGRLWGALVVPLLVLLIAIDGSMHPLAFTSSAVISDAPVYRVMRSAGPGVVIELPLPTVNRLPGWDALYSVWSIFHWHPLVNGYSGYHPTDYVDTMIRMETFPDNGTLERLKAHQVRYLIVHRDFLSQEQYTSVLLRIANRPEFRSWGTYRDPIGVANLFVFEP